MTAPRPHLTLLLGGVRAGKSAKALSMARASEGSDGVLFVATAQAFDDEMRQRIAVHQRERPPHWRTLESPLDVSGDLQRELEASPDVDVVVIDCLTLWVSNILLSLDDDADAEAVASERVRDLLAVVRTPASRRWIVVSNEVGLGVVPPTSLGRRYRDALGRANQLVAAAAEEVYLMVAGLEMRLKP